MLFFSKKHQFITKKPQNYPIFVTSKTKNYPIFNTKQMLFNRNIYDALLKWKESSNRKPLLIRGSRQVGKTTLVKQFSKEFTHFINLNLERKNHKDLFEHDDVNKILNAALLQQGIVADKQTILLFIDEIQESPQAIQKLRYFFEDRPDIYVIAAGSLLEFAMQHIKSFPVGRISYLYLSPMNFQEFLAAKKQFPALKMLHSIPIPDYAHATILELFHEYAFVGGMPEAVSQYLENNNLSELPNLYRQLWQAYKDDVEKYAGNSTYRKIIRHLIDTAPLETDRIKFEGFGKSNYRSREVGESMRALDKSGIVRLIYPTTTLVAPIVPDLKKSPRLQFLDTGLLNQALQLQGEMILLSALDDFHRGKIIQHLVCQELISIFEDQRYTPHFWVREKKDSSSEVDIVFQHGKLVIPIEIKSGKQGRLRSLHQFIERANHPYAIRLYSGAFSVKEAHTPAGKRYFLMNLPYYLGTKIPQYVKWFIENYA